MQSEDSRVVAVKAREIYEVRFREEFERKYHGKYLCIEPQSGSYFLGDTFDQAVNAAIDAFPDRLTHTLRIGHLTALHLGVMVLQHG